MQPDVQMPNFYCIPWVYVCDGSWDCPYGYDESDVLLCGKNRTCTNLFRCVGSQIYIHLGNVCGGFKDCIQGDDELLCEIHNVTCPSKCKCLALALSCSHTAIVLSDISKYFPYLAITV